MSALERAERLIAQRKHRMAVSNRLDAIKASIAEGCYGHEFGFKTDPDVAERLQRIESDVKWCIVRLKEHNDREAA